MSGQRSRRTLGLAAALVLAAAALRSVGIGFLLPHEPEPDAVIVEQAAWLEARLAGEPTGEERLNTQYPLLLGVLQLALPSRAPGALAADGGALEQSLRAASWPHLRARLVVALIASAAPALAFLLARPLLGTGWAWLAGALTATSVLHVWFSQQARPHAALGALLLLGVLGARAFLRRGSLLSACGAGLAAAAATACLHSGLLVLPALALAQVLRFRSERRVGWARLAAPWIVLAAVAALAYPGVAGLVPRMRIDREVEGSVALTGHSVPLASFDGGGFARLARCAWEFDPWLAILAAAGIGAGLWRVRRIRELPAEERGELLVLLAGALTYALAFGIYGRTVARFVVPLVPVGATLAAFALRELARASGGGRAVRWAALVLGALALAASTAASARLVWLRSRPDSLTQAARWVREHVDPREESVAVTASTSLPLFHRMSATARPSWSTPPWDVFQRSGKIDRGGQPPIEVLPLYGANLGGPGGALSRLALRRFLDEHRPAYAVIEVRPASSGGQDASREVARERGGEPIETFRPDPRRAEPVEASGYNQERDVIGTILWSRFLGPPVEIYRLPR